MLPSQEGPKSLELVTSRDLYSDIYFSESQPTFQTSKSPKFSELKSKSINITDYCLFYAGYLPGLLFASEDTGN
jgi:hypothetical protein